MQLAEFKAWFEGYTESMKGPPTAKQWDRIKERIAEVDGKPITERVFVDRYWPGYWPTYVYQPLYSPPSRTYTTFNSSGSAVTQYSSTSAMYLLGKTESVNGATSPMPEL